MDLEKSKALFSNPPMDHRPAPFWFWNDRLDPERLVWQYDLMLDAGMGGAVMHARGGLDPEEYLDERWFAGVKAVVEHARERGGCAWIYDELGWPSGSAGGRLPRMYPELRLVHLHMDDVIVGETPLDGIDLEAVVAAFHVTRTDINHGFQRRHDKSALLQPDRIGYEAISLPFDPAAWAGKRVLLFRPVVSGALNYLDPKATAKFLELTHEEYYRRFKEFFGTTITHTFMDEAGMMPPAASLPWEYRFAETFEQRRGYSLLPHLPALFFEVPGHEAIRYDFWSLATELFREGFGVPMHAWHEAHDVAYSGHYLCEATLKEATRQTGGVMPLYEFQGLPGIDILGNDFYSRRFEQEAYSYYVVTIKQASSVNHQLAKGGLLSESYGVGGHAMGPEAMQTATNFQMALGVTHICQHAPFYSIRAERKLDCPPFIDWHEPYWKFVKKHFDAISRTGWLLNQGEHQCDVLLLHPMSSMHATYRHYRVREENKAENYLFDADMPFELVDKHFTRLSVALLDAQIDHDYGDEELMARHGAVEGAGLRIGVKSYPLVVLPALVNLRSSTLELLRRFAEAGGQIIVVGSAPRLLDGRPSEEPRKLLDEHALRITDGVDMFDYGLAVAELTARGARVVTLKTDDDDVPAIKAQRRTWDGREILYLANVSREATKARMTCTFGVTGRLEAWDTSTGATWPLAPCTAGEEITLDLDWEPRAAKTLVAVPGEVEITPQRRAEPAKRISPEWAGTRTEPNVLVLDECRIIEAGRPSALLSITQARDVLAERLEKDGQAAEMVTQYVVRIADGDAPVEGLELALELTEGAALKLNGEEIEPARAGWMLDPAIERVALPPLRRGENAIEVKARYAQATHLQSPWLLGAFDVDAVKNPDFTIEPKESAVPLGTWPEVGLPFYSGTVTYRAEVELDEVPEDGGVMLEMPGLAGSAEIRVNGATVDHVLWPPYACEITKAVKPGKNVVEVEVANTLRNLLGPHYEPREKIMTGMSNQSYAGVAGEQKLFWDYGLLSAPEIVILQ